MMSQAPIKKGLWVKISKAAGEEPHRLILAEETNPPQRETKVVAEECAKTVEKLGGDLKFTSWPTKPPLFGGTFKAGGTTLSVYLSLNDLFSGVRGSGTKLDIATIEEDNKLEDWIATKEGKSWLAESETITYFLVNFEVKNDLLP